MKRIVYSFGAPFIERRGSVWVALLSIVLGVAWVVAATPGFITGDSDLLAFSLVTTLVLGVPAILLAAFKGSRRRYRVAAVVEAREVPGGIHVVVLDAKGRRHELVTAREVVERLVASLTGTVGRS